MIVDLEPTEDQRLIAESVGALLRDTLPVARLRDAAAWRARAERAAWASLVELGLFSLGVPQDQGGAGYGLPEEIVVGRLLGENLISLSVVAQVAAAPMADAQTFTELSDGTARVAFANPSHRGGLQLIDADDATHVLMLGRGARLLPRSALGRSTPIDSIDETMSFALCTAPAASPDPDPAAERISLLLAAYLVGIATASRDMAVAYAKTREQFGQPIGAFQAIKHMAADMAVRAAGADAQVGYTAAILGHCRPAEATENVAGARLLADEAALGNAVANIQIHGGMGFTAECDAHLYLKRARVVSVLGSSRRALERSLI